MKLSSILRNIRNIDNIKIQAILLHWKAVAIDSEHFRKFKPILVTFCHNKDENHYITNINS